MNFLNAVKKGRPDKPHSPHSTHSTPTAVAEPAATESYTDEGNEEVVPEETVQEPIQTEEDPIDDYPIEQEVQETDAKLSIGRFGRIDFDDEAKEADFWQLFVITAGPQAVCNLALTCRYFFGKLLSKEMWSLLGKQEPATTKPTIKFFIDISPVEAKDDDTEVEERIQTVPLSQVRTENQRIQLVKFWLRSVTKAYSVREQKLAEGKQDDPLFKKPELEAVLHGGFTIEEGKKNQLVVMRDLSKVCSWLEAVSKLLGKERSVTVPHENGKVTLTRVGRGGSLLSLVVHQGKETEKALFEFDDFCMEIRNAAKEFIPVAGSCRMGLIKLRKTVEKNETASFKEKENWIAETIGHDHLNQIIKSIKQQISGGAIPRSRLPKLFTQKYHDKQKRKVQASTENDNIMDFIFENLPPNWEDTKKALTRLTELSIQQRDNERNEFQAKMDAQKQQRAKMREEQINAAKKQAASKTPEGDWDTPDIEEKRKKVKKGKVVDKDGFISIEAVDDDGNKIAEPEKQPEKVQKQQNQPKGEVKKTKAATTTTPAANPLVENPYAAALKEKSFEPISQLQHKQQIKKAQNKPNPTQKIPEQQPSKKENKDPSAKNSQKTESGQKKNTVPLKPTQPKNDQKLSQTKTEKQTQTSKKGETTSTPLKTQTPKKAGTPAKTGEQSKPKKGENTKNSKTDAKKGKATAGFLPTEWAQPVMAAVGLLVVVVLGYTLVLS